MTTTGLGASAAAQLLSEAQRALLAEDRPVAAQVVGLLRFQAEVRRPDPPEPMLVDERDVAALRELEAVPA